MILFKWGSVTEDKVEFDQLGLRSWRKVFEVFTWHNHKKFFGIGAGINTEITYKGSDWHAIKQAAVTLTRRWAWGREHMYYDGCLCSFSVGFLHFNWEPDHCDGCWREGFGDEPPCRNGSCAVKGKP